MNHHAFVIEGEKEAGIERARAWVTEELGLAVSGNPDIVVLSYGLLSVEEARRIAEVVAGAPFAGESKAVIIAASRAYHEAQNALLKLFEEPPPGTYLFLILPTLGGLLPTLRSRVVELKVNSAERRELPENVEAFLKAGKEKRSALVKKLATGSDEEERRENREEAIALLNGIEAAAYAAFKEKPTPALTSLLADIAVLRGHLHDRSAPVKMILEHLSLVVPGRLV